MEMSCMNIEIFHEERNTDWKTQEPTRKQGSFIFVMGVRNLWLIAEYYSHYKYVTARKADKYLLAGKSTWRGWDNCGDPRILILDGLTPFGVSVVCRLVPGDVGLLSSVRPSGVPYGGQLVYLTVD